MLGNLDNLSLGMGLTLHRKQVIPARHANFQGLGQSTTYQNRAIELALLAFALYLLVT